MANSGRVVAGLLAGLTWTGPAWAQSGPDPGTDPIGWLKANLGGAACVVYDVGPSPTRLERVTENTEVQFDGCQMVLQQANVEGTHSEVRTFRIPLAALATTAATARPGFDLPEGWISRGDVPTHTITIATPAGQPLIAEHVESFDGIAPGDGTTNRITLLVRHEENARQIVRAMTRAIELCRQR